MAGKVDPHYARGNQAYEEVLNASNQRNQCPWCRQEDGSFVYHQKPILAEEDGWLLTENMHPYRHADGQPCRCHLLLVPVRHIELFSELTPEDFRTIQKLICIAENRFSIIGAGLALRYGETQLTGATVSHLHLHLIVPELEPSTGRAKVIYFPVG